VCLDSSRQRQVQREKRPRSDRCLQHRRAQVQEAGITFTYHCHGYEFQPFGDGTLFDLIVKETKPDSVFFELDVFWAQQGGADPARLLEKHGSRFKLMHVKDLRKGAAKNSTGGAPDEDSVPVVRAKWIGKPS
jgi:sugar phosphate isomerase/epimerase